MLLPHPSQCGQVFAPRPNDDCNFEDLWLNSRLGAVYGGSVDWENDRGIAVLGILFYK